MILEGTPNKTEEEAVRRKDGKVVSKSRQGWTFPVQLRQLKTEASYKSSLV